MLSFLTGRDKPPSNPLQELSRGPGLRATIFLHLGSGPSDRDGLSRSHLHVSLHSCLRETHAVANKHSENTLRGD